LLVFPLLAASLVFPTSAIFQASPAVLSDIDPAPQAAGDARCAKKPTPKREISAAKQPSRGRTIAPSVTDLGEGGAYVVPPAKRDNPYVCPSDMVMIGRSYCIDVYEASLVQTAEDGTEKPFPYYQLVSSDTPVRAISVPGVFPQGYISGVQARDACEHSGKRLCKPDEWKNACMGPKKTIFPYGNTREVGRCNDNGRSAMHFFNAELDDLPEHRWMWGYNGNMIDPRLNQLEGTLTRSGERTGCTNEYGVYDMVGNLHEWVDDPDGTFQGGYYLDTHLNGDGCFYRTTAHPMSHLDYSTGFRCCADVESL
jgi:sulfatase modifying factor 1